MTKGAEPKYTVKELKTLAKKWKTTEDVVEAALKIQGMETATVDEAERAVEHFLRRKVGK